MGWKVKVLMASSLFSFNSLHHRIIDFNQKYLFHNRTQLTHLSNDIGTESVSLLNEVFVLWELDIVFKHSTFIYFLIQSPKNMKKKTDINPNVPIFVQFRRYLNCK